MPFMRLLDDLRVLYHLALKPVRGHDHAARLESFYSGQAEAYDRFRRRLLHGREEMWNSVQVPDDGVWVDMGGGTGSNLEILGDSLSRLRKVYIVDLSPSLLEIARRRISERGWANVEAVEADATAFRPAEGSCDVVTFSYSLTMIPEWFAAMDNARSILAPGGQIAAVDFYVARKHPLGGLAQHAWSTRSFWPVWFAMDNVMLSPDHIPYLHRAFEPLHFVERCGTIPFMPFVRAPYYIYHGRNRPAVLHSD